MRNAARALAAGPKNTPDVLQARALLAAELSAGGEDEASRAEALAMARTLLEAGVDTPTPERVLWETRVYSVQTCARNLAASGKTAEALELFNALAKALPGTKIADACSEDIGALFHRKPLPLENAAQ